jgi:hypothetical protein
MSKFLVSFKLANLLSAEWNNETGNVDLIFADVSDAPLRALPGPIADLVPGGPAPAPMPSNLTRQPQSEQGQQAVQQPAEEQQIDYGKQISSGNMTAHKEGDA